LRSLQAASLGGFSYSLKIISMQNLTLKDHKKLFICLAIYLTSLIAANTLGIKLMPFIWGTHLSVSIFYFPFVYLMTDVVGEVYGKEIARQFVLAGILTTLLFLAFNIFSIVLPWSHVADWVRGSYDTVFGVSIRVSIASVVAFAVAEYQDVVTFFFFKKKAGASGFWLRANLATLWSELLDTVVFMVIAFYGVYDNHTLILMIVPWYLYKVAMGALYTPLSYIGINLLKKKYGNQIN
jgi:uncharacterized integral membrane protein (TIGR00697 family)